MNPDEAQLIAKTVDPNGNIIEQILRIACYDEYRANAYYQKVIDTFGPIAPFTNIAQAEVRHFSMIEGLCYKYGVTPPVNDWYNKTIIGPTLLQCCQDGMTAEIDNIQMYDYLLGFVTMPDIQEVFYREQAASYNNHLPAFTRCVESYTTTNSRTTSSPQGGASLNQEEILQAVQGLVNGKTDVNTLSQIATSLASRDMLIGLAAGAVLAMTINSDTIKEKIDTLFNTQTEE